MKRCSKCNSLMPADAPTCIKCGFTAALQPAPTPPPPLKPAPARPAVAPIASFAPGERPGKIRGAWLLTKQSWRVLMQDKTLLVFPLLSGISCLLVMASFAAGAFASGVLSEQAHGEAAFWAMTFAFYFVNYFVIVYFNSALVACAMTRFRGG